MYDLWALCKKCLIVCPIFCHLLFFRVSFSRHFSSTVLKTSSFGVFSVQLILCIIPQNHISRVSKKEKNMLDTSFSFLFFVHVPHPNNTTLQTHVFMSIFLCSHFLILVISSFRGRYSLLDLFCFWFPKFCYNAAQVFEIVYLDNIFFF